MDQRTDWCIHIKKRGLFYTAVLFASDGYAFPVTFELSKQKDRNIDMYTHKLTVSICLHVRKTSHKIKHSRGKK